MVGANSKQQCHMSQFDPNIALHLPLSSHKKNDGLQTVSMATKTAPLVVTTIINSNLLVTVGTSSVLGS